VDDATYCRTESDGDDHSQSAVVDAAHDGADDRPAGHCSSDVDCHGDDGGAGVTACSATLARAGHARVGQLKDNL